MKTISAVSTALPTPSTKAIWGQAERREKITQRWRMRKTAATATHAITSKDHSLAADVVVLPKVGLTDNNYKQQVKQSRVVVACLVTKRGALLRVALKVGEERLGVVFRLGGKPHVLPLTHTGVPSWMG